MVNAIVAFQEKDHDKLVDVWYRSVRHTHSFLTEENIQYYYDIVKNGVLREAEVWVERNGSNEPTGFIGLDGTKIEMLFVDPDYHGKGIGSRLIKHAQSIKGDRLRVDVNEQNEGARVFYAKFGFVQNGRSDLDGSGRPFPLLHLEFRK